MTKKNKNNYRYSDALSEMVGEYKNLSRPSVSGGPSMKREMDEFQESPGLSIDLDLSMITNPKHGQFWKEVIFPRLIAAFADQDVKNAARKYGLGTIGANDLIELIKILRANEQPLSAAIVKAHGGDVVAFLRSMSKREAIPGPERVAKDLSTPNMGRGLAGLERGGEMVMHTTDNRPVISESTHERRPLSFRRGR